ncbi:MAG: MlaD family protein [Flavobacteriaceae bacterium]|nr:MlaD family protein [Flavobacteriaceae bacterium]MCY4216399.1 MlaD family protein [Flavobacteriaceae bacterium]MCY4253710.1 MlaD family protein [Flavobacteriaceae bacterium]
MKFSKEVKVTIIFVAGVALFIIGYSFLRNNFILSGSKKIYSYFENVEGLGLGAKVTVNGFSVGSVTGIDFSEDFSALKVEMNVRSDLTFSKNSTAILYETSLIGGRAIQIIPVYEADVIQQGDVLPSVIKPVLTALINDQFAPLQTKLENLISNLDSLVIGFNAVFDNTGQVKLRNALEDFTLIVDNVNQLSSEIVVGIRNNQEAVNQTLTDVAMASKNMKSLSDSLIGIDLNYTVSKMNNLIGDIDSMVSLMQSNKGTIGQLVTDPNLYENLNQTTQTLNALMLDLQTNPKKYVHFSLFGRRNKTKTNNSN